MKSLKEVLMSRDGLSSTEADERILDARERLIERISEGDQPFDFCEEEFGLEPDYLEDLIC
jgi:hypothetical protein